jgi:hypothetical protein
MAETALVAAAIIADNAAGGGTVTLTPDCTYTLTTSHGTGHGPDGLPLITTPISLAGNVNTITRSAAAPAFRSAESPAPEASPSRRSPSATAPPLAACSASTPATAAASTITAR